MATEYFSNRSLIQTLFPGEAPELILVSERSLENKICVTPAAADRSPSADPGLLNSGKFRKISPRSADTRSAAELHPSAGLQFVSNLN
jgi:hypothetical protein